VKAKTSDTKGTISSKNDAIPKLQIENGQQTKHPFGAKSSRGIAAPVLFNVCLSLATRPLLQLKIASVSGWSIPLALQDDKYHSAHDRDDVERQIEKISNDCVWRELGERFRYHLTQP
jgi:hypothetical protein